MTFKQRESLQRAYGILWALSYNSEVGEPLTDAMDLLDGVLDDDVRKSEDEDD